MSEINLFLSLFLVSLLSALGNSSAQDTETGLEELFAIFTEEELVVSALKNPQTVSKSPAIMSVVTAKQIKQMGFRTLTQVLKIVPGFDISMDRTGETDIGVRGVLKRTSEIVKV